jgi:hypothetical protein
MGRLEDPAGSAEPKGVAALVTAVSKDVAALVEVIGAAALDVA